MLTTKVFNFSKLVYKFKNVFKFKKIKGEYFYVTDQNKNSGSKANDDNSSDVLVALSVTFSILGMIGGAFGVLFYIKKKRSNK